MVLGLKKAMFKEGLKGEVVNLGNPSEKTIKETALMVKDMLKSASEIVYHELPEDDPKRRNPDIEKTKRLLDWEPQVSFDKGLTETISYFKSL